jgi:hypothetical protein
MRRSAALLAPLVAVGATVGVAVPAAGGPPERMEFTVAECAADGALLDMWESGPVLHLSAENVYDLYVMEEDEWRMYGQNTTNPMGTVRTTRNGKEVAPFRGTFSIRDDGTVGDFDGTWSWGVSAVGRAVGHSPDGSALLTLTLYEDEVDIEGQSCGVTTYHVMSK